MKTLESYAELLANYPPDKNLVFRVVGGLGSQLFSLSEAYELHKQTSKHIVLDYSSCDFLDSRGNSQSEILTNNYHWATPILIRNLESVKIQTNFIERDFPRTYHFINEGFIPNYRRVADSGLFTPGKFPISMKLKTLDLNYIAFHFRHSPLYKGNLGNITEYYLKSIVAELKEQLQTEKVFVFSNNSEFAKQIFTELFEKVGCNFELGSIDDPLAEIYLMSQSKILVCSNSAMSWWASYFGNQLSFFPKPFYLGYWNWAKEFYGPNMKQRKQFRFMLLNKLKCYFLKYFRARGIIKKRILTKFNSHRIIEESKS